MEAAAAVRHLGQRQRNHERSMQTENKASFGHARRLQESGGSQHFRADHQEDFLAGAEHQRLHHRLRGQRVVDRRSANADVAQSSRLAVGVAGARAQNAGGRWHVARRIAGEAASSFGRRRHAPAAALSALPDAVQEGRRAEDAGAQHQADGGQVQSALRRAGAGLGTQGVHPCVALARFGTQRRAGQGADDKVPGGDQEGVARRLHGGEVDQVGAEVGQRRCHQVKNCFLARESRLLLLNSDAIYFIYLPLFMKLNLHKIQLNSANKCKFRSRICR